MKNTENTTTLYIIILCTSINIQNLNKNLLELPVTTCNLRFFSLRVPGLENDWFASMVPPSWLVGWTGPRVPTEINESKKNAPFESSHRCWHHLSNEYCTLALGTSYQRRWLWRFESGIQVKGVARYLIAKLQVKPSEANHNSALDTAACSCKTQGEMRM